MTQVWVALCVYLLVAYVSFCCGPPGACTRFSSGYRSGVSGLGQVLAWEAKTGRNGHQSGDSGTCSVFVGGGLLPARSADAGGGPPSRERGACLWHKLLSVEAPDPLQPGDSDGRPRLDEEGGPDSSRGGRAAGASAGGGAAGADRGGAAAGGGGATGAEPDRGESESNGAGAQLESRVVASRDPGGGGACGGTGG